MEALFVEPGDPAADGDLEVVEAPPGTAVGGDGSGVAVQLGLEQPDGGLRHGIVETVPDRADGRCGADLGETARGEHWNEK